MKTKLNIKSIIILILFIFGGTWLVFFEKKIILGLIVFVAGLKLVFGFNEIIEWIKWLIKLLNFFEKEDKNINQNQDNPNQSPQLGDSNNPSITYINNYYLSPEAVQTKDENGTIKLFNTKINRRKNE